MLISPLVAYPEYLKRINKHSSIQIGICEESFKKDSYFSNEKKRIFISSFATNVHYQEIVDYLSQVKFASKKDIEKSLHTKGGGNLTNVLKDLEMCGFIERYLPYQADSNSNLVRYCIADSYLKILFQIYISFDLKESNKETTTAHPYMHLTKSLIRNG